MLILEPKRLILSGLCFGLIGALSRTYDSTRANATGTNAYFPRGALNDGLHSFKIWKPACSGFDVRMGDEISALRAFFTNLTNTRHTKSFLDYKK